MEVRIQYIINGRSDSDIYIGEEEAFFVKNNKKVFVPCDKERRFNTLISLFGLKTRWKSEDCDNPRYLISFKDNNEESVYSFDIDLPFNFLLFNSCVVRLLGDNYE